MMITRSIILIILLTLTSVPDLYSAEVLNLRTGQQGHLGFAQYDLAGMPGQKDADVDLVIEIGSNSYHANKLSLRGDVGKGIKIGEGRKVYWDILQDLPNGIDADVTWIVTAADPSVTGGVPVITAQGKGFTDPAAGMVFVPVPGGCFTMGDIFNDGEADEKPTREICVDSFLIGQHEITQGQWQTIMGNNPAYFNKCGKTCPVESVSWTEVQQFILKLNERTEKSYRLPTEAEWEYAARSGGRRERYSGSAEGASHVAWYEVNGGGKTHAVGQKKANGLGIYDMSGNVAEWVSDWKGNYQPSDRNNPAGPTSGTGRVLRGGAWLNSMYDQRTSSRSDLTPSVRTSSIGFRLVLPVQTSP